MVLFNGRKCTFISLYNTVNREIKKKPTFFLEKQLILLVFLIRFVKPLILYRCSNVYLVQISQSFLK